MTTPNKYRSVFTGIQIDQILASVQNKLDASVIVNNYSGGTDQVASAELAKLLDARITSLSDPNFLKTLISNSIKTGATEIVGDTILLAEYDSTKNNGAKAVISCKDSTGKLQLTETLFGKSSTGNFVNPIGSTGDGGLFTLSVAVVGNRIQLIGTAVVANLTFTAERVSIV